MFIKLIYTVCLVWLIFTVIYTIKNRVAYRNFTLINYAICRYNIALVDKAFADGKDPDELPYLRLSTCLTKSYDESFLDIFDWSYKNLVSPEVLEKLEPYIEKRKSPWRNR